MNTRKNEQMTLVNLLWIEGKIEHWLRFGNYSYQQRLDAHRRIVGFLAHEIFAFVRWAASDYGTVVSRLDIVRTVPLGFSYQTIPHVQPGGEILLKVHGLEKVGSVLDLIERITGKGIMAPEICPDYWRHVHNCLVGGKAEAHEYTMGQHQAWLKRWRIFS